MSPADTFSKPTPASSSFHRLSSACGKPAYRAFLPRTRVLIARAAKTFPSLRDPVTELLDRTAFWGAA